MQGRVACGLVLALLFSCSASEAATTRSQSNAGDSNRARRAALARKVAIPVTKPRPSRRLARATAAHAATLPPIKAGNSNPVPACATPGRLMAFVNARNGNLDGRFAPIATEYMRYGEELGLRWDYAFFQMLVETGNLSFRRGNGKVGDVKPSQNNFAGIGATGGGVPGESFPNVATGVKAHLQHVLMYSGERIEDPVADRTRKIQAWGVLASWQKGLKAPITYTDLTRRWAKDPRYSHSIGAVAKRFYEAFCDKSDPQPELVQEARSGRGQSVAAAGAASGSLSGTARSVKLADARALGGVARSGLGAGALARSIEEAAGDAAKAKPSDPPVEPRSAGKVQAEPQSQRPAADDQPGKPARGQTAMAAPITKGSGPNKCRVWTASYGGQRAIIIKATSDQYTNYTVLDVNEGEEKREADAYIAAYAKGGQPVGEFANQTLALERAFEFCPEG
jgi:hypothetical protein